MEKKYYEAPLTQIVDLLAEGVVCQSGGGLNGMPGYENGGDPFSTV